MLRFTPPGRARYVASTVNRGESETVARISVDIFASAAATMLFVGTAAVSMSVSAEATGVNTGSVHSGTAVVSVGITSTASANVTRSGVAAVSVGITSTCTGALATQTYYGTASINVGITATATGASVAGSTTHTGTADIQVNIDIVATGLTNNQIPDETVNGNHMTLYGVASLTSDAVIGTRAVVFDGSDDYGLINDNFQSTFQSPFSISMWVKPDDGIASPSAGDGSAGDYLFSTYDGDLTESFYYISRLANGKLHWHAYKDGSNRRTFQTDSAVFSDGSQSDYTHIVVTVSSTAVPLIYINGSSVNYSTGSADTGSVNISTYNGTANTYIAQQGNGTLRFTGKIDDISLWSTQLSSTQASNLYNSGSGTDLTGSSDLEGWWKMGEGSTATIVHTGTADIQVNIDITASGLTSNQIPDETANANHMTLYGAASLSTDAVIGTQAIAFDGSSGYGVIDDTFQSTFQSPFSISMWVKPDDGQPTGGSPYIYATATGGAVDDWFGVSHGTNGGVDGVLTITHNQDASSGYDSQNYRTTNSVFSDGSQSSYTHVVVTLNSSATPTVYINGSSVSLTALVDESVSLSNYAGTGNLQIAKRASEDPWQGKIDDVSIWSTELSSTDVTNLYNSGSGTSLTGSSNLAGWWKMGEGSTATIVHTGTASITASITASATGASVTGFSNTSVVEMDGTDDYMTTTFDTLGLASTGFSVSVWVKPSSSNVETTGTIYGRYNGSGSDRFALQLESTSLSKLSIHFGNSYSAFTHGMTMDAWNHICVVCEKATNWDAVIYVNGSSIGTKSVTAWTEHSSRVDMTVGSRRYSTFHLYEYTGLVDELAIYNTNIGTSDVASLYNSGNGPIDATTISDCVAYWRMGDGTEAGSGSTVYDMSTNSNDGTLVNAQFNTSDLP